MVESSTAQQTMLTGLSKLTAIPEKLSMLFKHSSADQANPERWFVLF
jgi:hypothetical protein